MEEESAGTACCGSRAAAVMEDWMIDSVVIDIGGWDDELDTNAIGRMIVTEFDAAGLDSRVFENGSVQWFAENLSTDWMHDSAVGDALVSGADGVTKGVIWPAGSFGG